MLLARAVLDSANAISRRLHIHATINHKRKDRFSVRSRSKFQVAVLLCGSSIPEMNEIRALPRGWFRVSSIGSEWFVESLYVSLRMERDVIVMKREKKMRERPPKTVCRIINCRDDLITRLNELPATASRSCRGWYFFGVSREKRENRRRALRWLVKIAFIMTVIYRDQNRRGLICHFNKTRLVAPRTRQLAVEKK